MAHQGDLIATNIEEYLKQHENKSLLRFITCGSVDDGKSTLIGRLLYDSKMIFEDQLLAIEKDSKKVGTQGGELDLALLVDGLQSEREQGITIDVAYRFFSTEKRKYIIADTPGHEQYTRNMATGASTADLAIILIDARQGVLTQTRRHSYIVSLLGIRHIVVAINKMDLVDFSEEKFETIRAEYKKLIPSLPNHEQIIFDYIPISALNGDNVVHPSEHTSWYEGSPLMELLDTVTIEHSKIDQADSFRFPVQYVNRPHLDFRGFCGTIASGTIKVGDEITVLPSGKTTIADLVHEKLKNTHIPLERIDSKDIRELIPGIGYSREDRNRHMHRIGHLIKTLQNNSISTIASFVSPYRESRKAIREMVKNNVVVYVKANLETCKARDFKGVYAKALSGELQNFSGVNDVYEEPKHAEITIDTDMMSAEEAAETIVRYLKKHYIKI